MRFLRRSLLVLWLSGVCALGGNELERLQRELRARKLYFGPIDGQPSADTTTAVRRFQRAKGLDATGEADRQTLRALGASAASPQDAVEAEMENCCDRIARFLQARERGDWKAEAVFYEESVHYFDEGAVDRNFIRTVHEREYERWPQRKYVLLNRIASPIADQSGEVLVTARIRSGVSNRSGERRARTEDVCFRMHRSGSGWRIAAMRLLEAPPR